jgi:hypothetical protein
LGQHQKYADEEMPSLVVQALLHLLPCNPLAVEA